MGRDGESPFYIDSVKAFRTSHTPTVPAPTPLPPTVPEPKGVPLAMEPSLRALEAGVIRINQALGLALLVRNDEANLRKVRDAAFTAAQAGRPCRRLGALLEAEVDAGAHALAEGDGSAQLVEPLGGRRPQQPLRSRVRPGQS